MHTCSRLLGLLGELTPLLLQNDPFKHLCIFFSRIVNTFSFTLISVSIVYFFPLFYLYLYIYIKWVSYRQHMVSGVLLFIPADNSRLLVGCLKQLNYYIFKINSLLIYFCLSTLFFIHFPLFLPSPTYQQTCVFCIASKQ